MATNKELAERLGSVPLFERCTKKDLRIVARHVETTTLERGVTVVTEGEPGETFYLVLSGELDVTVDGARTATLGAGRHFGELALLDPAPRSATIITTASTELAVLSLRMFRVLLRDLPQISAGLLGSLAGQLRAARA